MMLQLALPIHRKTKTVLSTFITVLGVTACGLPSEQAPPGLQILLTDEHRVYLADWRGGHLEPRLLTDFKGTVRLSPTAIDATDNLVAVAGVASDTGKPTVYLIDAFTGEPERTFEGEHNRAVTAIAMGPGTQAIALILSSPGGERGDVVVYDLRERRTSQVVRGQAAFGLSWRSNGEQLTYDNWLGPIQSVTLKSQRIERIVDGISPAWSPDGTKLAYHRNHALFIYDPAQDTSQEVHRSSRPRYVWGSMHWSPDGRYILIFA